MQDDETPEKRSTTFAIAGVICGILLILAGWLVDLHGREWLYSAWNYQWHSKRHLPESLFDFLFRRILPEPEFAWKWAYALQIFGACLAAAFLASLLFRKKETRPVETQ